MNIFILKFLWIFLFIRIRENGKIGIEDFLIKKKLLFSKIGREIHGSARVKKFSITSLKDIYIVLYFCIIGFFIEKQLRIEHS